MLYMPKNRNRFIINIRILGLEGLSFEIEESRARVAVLEHQFPERGNFVSNGALAIMFLRHYGEKRVHDFLVSIIIKTLNLFFLIFVLKRIIDLGSSYYFFLQVNVLSNCSSNILRNDIGVAMTNVCQ